MDYNQPPPGNQTSAQTENPICSECGFSHPIIPGERCSVKLAEEEKLNNLDPKHITEIKKPKEKSIPNTNNKSTTSHPGVDQDIYNILIGLGVKLSSKIEELELDTIARRHILSKYKLIIEQKLSDCVHTLLEDFKL